MTWLFETPTYILSFGGLATACFLGGWIQLRHRPLAYLTGICILITGCLLAVEQYVITPLEEVEELSEEEELELEELDSEGLESEELEIDLLRFFFLRFFSDFFFSLSRFFFAFDSSAFAFFSPLAISLSAFF